MEKLVEELRADIARFGALLARDISSLPAKHKWISLGEKYRAKTPDMWSQTRTKLTLELAAKTAIIRRWTNRIQQRADTRGLASGIKSYMAKKTSPPVQEDGQEPADSEEQERKLIDVFTCVWNQPSTEQDPRDEEWFTEHATAVKQTIGNHQVRITVESVQAALTSTAAWKAPGFDGVYGFFLKHVSALHAPIAAEFAKILDGTALFPSGLPQGEQC